jgi:hypothetical protein
MNFKEKYPDFAAIETQIRHARAERSLAVSQAFLRAGESIVRGTKKLFAAMGDGYLAERDRRAIEADAFLKRSVPRY